MKNLIEEIKNREILHSPHKNNQEFPIYRRRDSSQYKPFTFYSNPNNLIVHF
jgi:hypothetical protein